jgi:hypothetical protein
MLVDVRVQTIAGTGLGLGFAVPHRLSHWEPGTRGRGIGYVVCILRVFEAAVG